MIAQAPGHPVANSITPKEDRPLAPRVLIADDHPDHLKLASRILTSLGCKVASARDGREALNAFTAAGLSGNTFDLVLLDVSMPELDGCEAVSTIRDSGHQGPIFAITAYVDAESLERCIRSGFDYAISKPLTRESLAEASEFLLSSRGS